MSTTYEEILHLFRETDRKFQDTDRKFQDTDRKFQDTDRKFQETERLLKEQTLETERLLREQSAAAQKKLDQLEDLFTGQWGRLMESLVEGDLVNLLKARGIAIADTSSRIKGQCPDGGNYEFDLIAHNGDEIVVVEVKTTLRPRDVKKFLGKLDQLKKWMPRYAQNRIYGAMAWLTADAGSEAMVIKRGLFSIRATGDSAAIQNDPAFTPRAW
jgi:Holliday junction resolvase